MSNQQKQLASRLSSEWQRSADYTLKEVKEHNAKGEWQYAAWKCGYAAALETAIKDLQHATE